MIESTDGTSAILCAEIALLVEKGIADEPLSAAEQQTVDYHLDGCRQCRDSIQWTSGIPYIADILLEDELDFAISSVLKIRNDLRRQESRRRFRWATYVAAASVAAVMLVGILVFALLSNQPSAGVVPFQCAPSHATEPVAGVFMTYCEGEEPGTIIENGGDVRVSLRNGTVGLLIDPARPDRHKVTVETPRGEVRVKGTVFAVHVDEDGAWVEVFRGVVEVVSADGDENASFVSAGQGAALDTRKTYNLSTSKAEMLLVPLRVAAGDAADDLGFGTDNNPNRRGDEGGAESSATIDSGAPLGEMDNSEPRERIESEPHKGTGPVSKRSALSVDALIQEAQSCLLVRDWNCAAARYHEALKHHAGRPESTAVLISLAKIELRHLNSPQKALAHYRSYQQRAPDGPLAEEALFGIASAYRRLGVEDKETETLRQFVSKYPKSSLLGKARARLEQLGGVEAL